MPGQVRSRTTLGGLGRFRSRACVPVCCGAEPRALPAGPWRSRRDQGTTLPPSVGSAAPCAPERPGSREIGRQRFMPVKRGGPPEPPSSLRNPTLRYGHVRSLTSLLTSQDRILNPTRRRLQLWDTNHWHPHARWEEQNVEIKGDKKGRTSTGKPEEEEIDRHLPSTFSCSSTGWV